MLIKTKDLHELLYNTILFTARKSAAGPTIQLNLKEGFLYGRATNDIDCIETKVPIDVDLEWTDYISLESAKAAEKFLRDVNQETLEMDLHADPEFTLCLDTSLEHHDINLDEKPDESVWGDAVRLLSYVPYKKVQFEDPFAVAPERLRKYSLLKPGDYPIDFFNQEGLLYWKCGPNTHGVLAALDRVRIFDKFGPEGVWDE